MAGEFQNETGYDDGGWKCELRIASRGSAR